MNNTNKILWLFVMLFICRAVAAQQLIQFEKGGFSAALKQSKITHKPIFFMCYASWCPHCNKMKEQVFTDSAVANFYNQHFVCIEQDMEKGQGITLHEIFKIKSYPTIIFFDSSGETIYRTTGEFKAQAFIQEGINALTTEKQLPFLRQQFESEISNADKCYTYLTALKKGDIDYSPVVKAYFSTQTTNELLSEKNWKIIANGVTDINSREFQYLLNHQQEFSALTSTERVERKIYAVVKDLFTSFVNNNDTISYFTHRPAAVNIHQFKIDSLIFMCDIKLYENTQSWAAYKKQTLQLTQTYLWNDYNGLNNIAKVYLTNIVDTTALTQAVNWTNRSLALNEDYGIYLLNAKLHQKINDTQGAIEMAKRAKQMALKYGWDFSEADDLLKKIQ